MRAERLDWVDGLRGMAVLMVVLSHAFQAYLLSVPAIGAQGVSLFFVLSGFCLSYAPLRRRNEQRATWFGLRRFALARCRRILPPYYAALAVFVPLNLLFTRLGWIWPGASGTPSAGDIIAHRLLLHNFNPSWVLTIDGPMWSLATEWQWYLVFPLLLWLCIRHPRTAVLLSFVIALNCTFLPLLSFMGAGQFVPVRLVEFCLGILAARAVVEERRIPPLPIIGLVSVAGLVVINVGVASPVVLSLYYPICGIAFAGLILLTARASRLCTAISWSPLVRLGVISYSVYLIHYPVLTGVQRLLHSWPPWAAGMLGLGIALPISYGFFLVVERPLLRHEPRRAAPAAMPETLSASNA